MYSVGQLFGNQQVMTYYHEGLLFVYYGGEYIDVAVESDDESEQSFHYNYKGFVYSESNINVWDYETATPSISWLDSVAFIAECEEWMADL